MIVRMKAPTMVPASPPRPPNRLMPPITAAATVGRMKPLPTVGEPVPVWVVR